ncbi:MAG TPA: thiamine diphosphokinase [Patescibacteria group bacterium]|jgi:thiamine pyrophosphokinase|nr:thiamine diphosphokinase [Patescibacteria group bacterium]
MTILIFANGLMGNLDWVRPLLKDDCLIIAADGGAKHVADLGIEPDIVIGDFDSIAKELLEQLSSSGALIISHSELKDETDLELALLYAINHHEGDIKIFGSLGGRLDQTMGNIFLLAHPAFSGRHIELVEPDQRAWLISVESQIDGSIGDTLSLIPFGEGAHIRRTTGLKWELIDEKLPFGPARGISNVMTAKTATVTLESGRLLCVHIPTHQRL